MRFLSPAVLVALLVLWALSAPATAAGPPDPTRLDPDWWSYFTVNPEQESAPLAERVDQAVTRLRQLEEEFAPAERAGLAPLLEAVVNNLGRYQRFVGEQPPLPPPASPPRESYTLEEIRQLIDELRRAALDHASEVQEVARLEQAIDAGDRELSRRKVEYRGLDAAAPERLRLGLELMQSRLQIELARLELSWRRTNAKAYADRLDNLRTLAGTAAQRLTASEEAVEAAVRGREEAEQRARQLRSNMMQTELAQGGTLVRSPEEQSREQLTAQRLVLLETEAARQESLASQYGIMERLLRRVDAGNEPEPAEDRDALKAHQTLLQETADKVETWRRSTARNRETALGRLADTSERSQTAVLEQRLTLADATERALRELEEQLVVASQFGNLLDSLLAEREGSVARSVQTAEEWVGASREEILELLETSLFEIGGSPITAIDLFRVLLILTAAFWVSKLLRRTLERIAAKRESVNAGSVYTLGRVLHYVVLAVGIMIALSTIGIDFTKFALFASALGVGIGFGLQTLVSNFVAGLIILFEKSLKIGDFVELESGVTGEVREINMRSTLITTNDNIDIVVPNSEFVNGRVTNWTMREAYRRVRIPFGVAYGTDKELVRTAALEAAEEVPLTLTAQPHRRPQLWFVEFGDSSLNFELVVWLNPDAVKRPAAVQAAYLWEIDNKLRKYAIEVPFPQRDLHLRSVFGRTSTEGLYPGAPGGAGAAADPDQ